MILQYSKARVKLLQSTCFHQSIYSSKAALDFLPEAGVHVVRKFCRDVAVLDSNVAIVK